MPPASTPVMRSRLQGWDYGSNGAYFLTVCAYQRVAAFGAVREDGVRLTAIGELLSRQVLAVARDRPGIDLAAWVVMPDHVHLIVVRSGEPVRRVAVDVIVAGLKASVTLAARRNGLLATRRPLWQRGFYDRVIRNDLELQQLREYIANNPIRWRLSGR
jgi:REP element-mobilizing transposase RayT